MRACELGVTLKNFDVCTVIMDVACPLLQRSIIIHPWHYPQDEKLNFLMCHVEEMSINVTLQVHGRCRQSTIPVNFRKLCPVNSFHVPEM